MCLNKNVYETGRCDYCDARCPYYVDTDDFFNLIESDGTIERLHKMAIKKIEDEMKNKK